MGNCSYVLVKTRSDSGMKANIVEGCLVYESPEHVFKVSLIIIRYLEKINQVLKSLDEAYKEKQV